MAKKRRKSKKRENQPATRLTTEQMMQDITRMIEESGLESIDEINAFMQEKIASGEPFHPSRLEPQTDLEEAQQLIYDAYDARTKSQAMKLARKALDISYDCADAYVLLAEADAKTAAEALALYEAGIKAGERVLGDEFEEMKGHFWGILETRPYMRARLGAAIVLWSMERFDEAADHMAALLELNPNDNQGVRHTYIVLLQEMDDSKRIDRLLKQYPDDWSATWKYSHALHLFRKKGKSKQADKKLLDAIDFNPHVVSYLLGKKKMPKKLNIAFYSPGDESEALDYLIQGLRVWMETEGAIEWVREIHTGLQDTPDEA